MEKSMHQKKIEFIKSWYNDECEKLNFSDKLKLARAWTDICLKDEEYEMASTLHIEKLKMVKRHVKNKKNNRSSFERFAIWIYLKRRKFRAWMIKRKF